MLGETETSSDACAELLHCDLDLWHG